ncbi:MAG: flagellar export chaperone FliS [Deltaproteobacteria bacterium]|jgi:flagellar protein FliS|nr:flagellar export chaperone FliS [Deltaproteobacteria bacterium]
MQKAAYAYLQTNLTTCSPGETILALYDGAVSFLNRAKEQIDLKDYARKGILIGKAIDIINELSSSLNREKGGDIADNLHQLYFLCNTRLALANLKMDKKLIDGVIQVLSGLRDAFAQIQNTAEAQTATAQLNLRQENEVAGHARNLRGSPSPPPGQERNLNLRGRSLYNKMALNNN